MTKYEGLINECLELARFPNPLHDRPLDKHDFARIILILDEEIQKLKLQLYKDHSHE